MIVKIKVVENPNTLEILNTSEENLKILGISRR